MALNYVTIGSNDVPSARPFYDAVLQSIGGILIAEYMPDAFCYELRGGGRIWVVTPFDDDVARAGNGNMVGLECANRNEVRAAHRIGLERGGSDEGAPGPRPRYGPDFFAAYLRDRDGNKLSLVHFG